jgi:hypothetical protein
VVGTLQIFDALLRGVSFRLYVLDLLMKLQIGLIQIDVEGTLAPRVLR